MRTVLFVLIPLVMLGLSFSRMSTKADPPAALRTAHPAPPAELTYRDKVIGPHTRGSKPLPAP